MQVEPYLGNWLTLRYVTFAVSLYHTLPSNVTLLVTAADVLPATAVGQGAFARLCCFVWLGVSKYWTVFFFALPRSRILSRKIYLRWQKSGSQTVFHANPFMKMKLAFGVLV